jgi:hypothetical protein
MPSRLKSALIAFSQRVALPFENLPESLKSGIVFDMIA